MGTQDFLYANRDAEFRSACDAIPLADCDRIGTVATGCEGCPAWEALKERVAARTTASEQPGVLTRRSET